MGRVYQERCCAFIDFLGFKEIVKNKNPEVIYGIIEELSNLIEGGRQHVFQDLKYQAFSDNIFITTPPTPEGLTELFVQVRWLILTALERGAFIRGGITIGDISQNETNNILFGPALIEAFELESKYAKHPRTILSKSAIRLLEENTSKAFIKEQLCQSQDGAWYLHIFQNAIKDKYPDWKATFKPIIEKSLKENTDNTVVYKKLAWFAKYYNNTVAEEFGHYVGIYEQAKTDEPVDLSQLINLPEWP